MFDSKELQARIKELNPTIHIREAALNDADKFVELFNSYYVRKTNAEYFRWQFFESPCKKTLYLAFDGELLVGFFGIKEYPITGEIKNGFTVDFLVHESYRKRGIALLLESEIERFARSNNIKLLTALPNLYGNAAFKALGWKSIAKIDTLIHNHLHKANIDLEKLSGNGSSLIEFVQTDSFRKWRFNSHPIYKYEKSSIDGSYIYTKVFTDPISGESYLDIVDIEFNNNIQSLGDLLKMVKTRVIETGIKTVTAWALPHTILYHHLRKIGFTVLPQSRFFCIKLLDLQYTRLLDINNWNLMEMDSEIY